jgi:hypothetical protein
MCTPLDAHYSTATTKLAMISYELGTKIKWDIDSHEIVGNPKANKMLKREYRAPWRHPYRG